MNFFKALFACLTFGLFAACGGGGGSPGSDGLVTSGADSSGSTSVSATFSASPNAAASIALAAGDKVDASNDIFYAERFAATVSDSNGVPVAGARISLGVTYPGYYKGQLNRAPDFKVTSETETFCAGEDTNNNDILDLGEDTNANGALEPAKALVTATVEGANVTDAKGNIIILVRWPRAHANWVLYRLNTSVTVTGTENRSSFNLRTSYAVGDEAKATTPFVVSPFGASTDCKSTN